MRLFSSPEIFILESRRMWYEKPAPQIGARKWSRFMAPVSGACVTGITVYYLRLCWRIWSNSNGVHWRGDRRGTTGTSSLSRNEFFALLQSPNPGKYIM